jgi:hypothetical protein
MPVHDAREAWCRAREEGGDVVQEGCSGRCEQDIQLDATILRTNTLSNVSNRRCGPSFTEGGRDAGDGANGLR